MQEIRSSKLPVVTRICDPPLPFETCSEVEVSQNIVLLLLQFNEA